MSKIRVLLVGESWISVSTHHKGFDYFSSGMYDTGHEYLKKACESDPEIAYTHMSGHAAAQEFPFTLEELKQWDVIILSDIGSNTLLLPKQVFTEGRTMPNRLQLLKQWVAEGGSLVMCGGYLSFAGFQASAKYFRTPVEDVLPVDIYTFDDRVETPEGVQVEIVDPDHPIVQDVPIPWPALLGYQEAVLKKQAHLIARTTYGHPFLATMDYMEGRSMVWMTDIGPHWCPKEFTEWPGYTILWQQAIKYLAHR